MLEVALGVVSVMFASSFVVHHQRQQAIAQGLQSSIPSLKTPVAIGMVCVSLAAGAYSQLGRVHDWDQGVLDQHLDYLMAAEITKARQRVALSPNNGLALLELANAYTAGGMYAEAVTTLKQVLQQQPQDAEILGLLATAMYYQDAKLMSVNTREVIDQALALYPQEMNTRLLLATHAYFQQDYQQAIEHWQQVLINDRQVIDTQAIQRAITNANNKMNNPLYPSEQNTSAAK